MSTVGTPLNVWWKSQQAAAGPVPPGASLALQPPSAPRVSVPSLPLIFFLPFQLFSFCVCPPKSRLHSLRHTSVCWRQMDMGATNPFSGPGGSHFVTRYDFAKLSALHLFLLFLISLPVESTYRGCVFVPPGFCDSWLSFGSRMLALCFCHHATWS